VRTVDRSGRVLALDAAPAHSPMTTRRPSLTRRKSEPASQAVIDLERYVPAYLTWIANKLSRGASQNYLRVFDVGIETWRCLVLLAIHESISAQQVSQVVGMDKASVSRCFKSMQARGLIMLGLDAADGRVRLATLTPKGRALHDQIRGIALERERALLSVFSSSERETLIKLLKRLHENLPAVEEATVHYVAQRFPRAARKRARPEVDSDD
jgi:DNA-binding MarR family transcriptional regulator